MNLLPKPYNWLHRLSGPRGGDGPIFAITAWSEGEVEFQPRGSSTTVRRPVTRIWIIRLDKPTPAAYYDISSQHLRAQLAGYLETASYRGLQFSVRATGRKPSKRLGLNASPIGSPSSV